MKKIVQSIIMIIVLCAGICVVSSFVYAAAVDEAKAQPAVTKTAAVKTAAQTEKMAAPVKMKDLSKEEMIARLKKMIEGHPDLLSEIRGLAVKEIDGKKYYEYNGKKFEDLDKDAVLQLLRASNQFISIQNNQRIQRQMDTIKQIENVSRLQRQIRLPQPPPQPPSVPKPYVPPRTYKTPGTY